MENCSEWSSESKFELCDWSSDESDYERANFPAMNHSPAAQKRKRFRNIEDKLGCSWSD